MKKELYFLAVKDIDAGDELKVWYAPHYAKKMCSSTLDQSSFEQNCSSPTHLNDRIVSDDNNNNNSNNRPVESSCSKVSTTNQLVLGNNIHSVPPSNQCQVDTTCSNLSQENMNPKKNYGISNTNYTNNNNNNNKCKSSRSSNSCNNPKRKKLTHKTVNRKILQPLIPIGQQSICIIDSGLGPETINIGEEYISYGTTINSIIPNISNESLLVTADNNISPLLLGARQLKDEWKCCLCNHTEQNVALYAKHLMSHYKSSDNTSVNTSRKKDQNKNKKPSGNESSNKQEFCVKVDTYHTCVCNKLLKTEEELDEHKNTCSQIKSLNPDKAIKSVVVVKEIVDSNCTNSNSINNENINTTKMVNLNPNNDINGKLSNQIESNGTLDVTDVCNIDINATNVNKDTNFECFNFDESLRDFEELNNDLTQSIVHNENNIKCKDSTLKNNGNINEEVNYNNTIISSELLSVVDNVKIKNKKKKNSFSNRKSLIKLIDNSLPPILDLTDEEIVFQNIKSFTSITDDEDDTDDNNEESIVITNDKLVDQSTNIKQPTIINVLDQEKMLIDQIDLLVNQQSTINNGNINDCKNDTNSTTLEVTEEYKNKFVDNLLSNEISVIANDEHINSTNDHHNDSNLTSHDNIGVDKEQIQETVFNFNSLSNLTIPSKSIGENNITTIRSNKDGNSIIGDSKEDVKQFQCDICKKTFTKSLYLYRHLKRHTGEYMCTICLAVFARKESLNSHICSARKQISSLLKKNERVCNVCSEVFSTKLELKTHQLTKHIDASSQSENTTTLICINCRKCYNSFAELQLHFDICTADNNNSDSTLKNIPSFLCDICGFVHKNKRSFILHLQTHGEPRFCCPICQKKFHRNNVLQSHLMSHQPDIATHECSKCNKKFKTKKSLSAHIKMHDKDRRFLCHECNMTFHQKGNLKRHLLKIHNQKSPPSEDNVNGETGNKDVFKCSLCTHTFDKEMCLKLHVKRVHNVNGNYTCGYCSAVFKHKCSLSKHINKNHVAEKKNESIQSIRVLSEQSPINSNLVENNKTDVMNKLLPLSSSVTGQNPLLDKISTSSVKTIITPIITCSNNNVNDSNDPSTNIITISTSTVPVSSISSTPNAIVEYMLPNDHSIIESVPSAISTAPINITTDCNDVCNNSDKAPTDFFYYVLSPSNVNNLATININHV